MDKRGRPIFIGLGRWHATIFNDLEYNFSRCQFPHTCLFCSETNARPICPSNPTNSFAAKPSIAFLRDCFSCKNLIVTKVSRHTPTTHLHHFPSIIYNKSWWIRILVVWSIFMNCVFYCDSSRNVCFLCILQAAIIAEFKSSLLCSCVGNRRS